MANEGRLRTFTIVSVAAPGIAVPYVSATIDCDGTSVRANVVNTDPTPEAMHTVTKVRLTTYVVGTDAAGVEAVSFAYEPVSPPSVLTSSS